MVPGDIYIGKETLDSYGISLDDPTGSHPQIELTHLVGGCDHTWVASFDPENLEMISTHDFLKSILEHEKRCTSNDKRPD